jgi:hypothetical protein
MASKRGDGGAGAGGPELQTASGGEYLELRCSSHSQRCASPAAQRQHRGVRESSSMAKIEGTMAGAWVVGGRSSLT